MRERCGIQAVRKKPMRASSAHNTRCGPSPHPGPRMRCFNASSHLPRHPNGRPTRFCISIFFYFLSVSSSPGIPPEAHSRNSRSPRMDPLLTFIRDTTPLSASRYTAHFVRAHKEVSIAICVCIPGSHPGIHSVSIGYWMSSPLVQLGIQS